MSTQLLLKPSRRGLLRKLLVIALITTGVPGYSQQQAAQEKVSTLTAKLVNIEAATNEPFRYSVTLHNGTATQQLFELKAELPVGWQMSSRVDGSQVTSVNLGPRETREIAIEISATSSAQVKKYIIPFSATSSGQTLSLQLEAVVKGSYGAALSTPTGRLSEELTAGSHKEIELEVHNTGTLPLSSLSISSQLPSGWEASFSPSQIEKLEGGKKMVIKATLKVPDKTIAGDYNATFNLTGNNATTQAAFRIFIKTSMLSGWIGIIIIAIAISAVYLLVRKFGRR
ncbi:COG1470 family protein [Pedobacter rhizosphaerae]|uniref:NPCBM-associated, NEW3 domain of alpha-galactosidase n=1 Tax=Pedobacter rhizosphaerae TaxID=390241 RepID=A0A1H9PMZ8_9SPHI|nr:NEW3 domain-containing protein [Pedobacter rhizosphaerae]SER49564.1 NPCBM-associated, NEW3 domain of alpha-galactosidase [Pedobacter rhizosphaerae]